MFIDFIGGLLKNPKRMNALFNIVCKLSDWLEVIVATAALALAVLAGLLILM